MHYAWEIRCSYPVCEEVLSRSNPMPSNRNRHLRHTLKVEGRWQNLLVRLLREEEKTYWNFFLLWIDFPQLMLPEPNQGPLWINPPNWHLFSSSCAIRWLFFFLGRGILLGEPDGKLYSGFFLDPQNGTKNTAVVECLQAFCISQTNIFFKNLKAL